VSSQTGETALCVFLCGAVTYLEEAGDLGLGPAEGVDQELDDALLLESLAMATGSQGSTQGISTRT
jgi:hypothetical protein